MSSEYTRRGQLWSKHASWHLPKAPRMSIVQLEKQMGYGTSIHLQGLEHVTAILNKFDVDPRRGFLPSQDPLQRLPYARYHLWEDLGDDLPKLLGARLGQAREPLRQLPVLATDKLVTDAELRRAHLLLCLFAHAYVWGGPQPIDVIPEGIARPLWEVSKRLGMPPVLGHPSIVLYNWRRLDSEADICMENLSTLNNFFDGRDESWFYLITVEVEARGAWSIVPIMLSIDAIQRYNEEQEHRRHRRKSRAGSNLSVTSEDEQQKGSECDLNESFDMTDYDPLDRRLLTHDEGDDPTTVAMAGEFGGHPFDEEALIGELSPTRVATYVTVQLKKVAKAIQGMNDSLSAMREGCHPFIFYHRVRPFLSAWKHNPTLPQGVIYEGVSEIRQQYYGGSAAQSSLLPFLDIALGVSHSSTKSQDFLLSMREYMPRAHREFLGYIESVACLRTFVVESLKNHGIEPDTRSDEPSPPSVSFSTQPQPPSSSSMQDLIGTPQSPAAFYWAAQQQQQEQQQQQQQQLQQQEQQLAAAASAAATAAAATNGTALTAEAAARRAKEKKVWLALRDAYDECIDNLQTFRTCHISLVADYIMAQQKNDKHGKPVSRASSTDNLEASAGGKGTGGTDLMKFLKPIRDNCGKCLLTTPVSRPGTEEPTTDVPADDEPYTKDNGRSEDIDLYRGAAYPTGRMLYTIPVDNGWNSVVGTTSGGSWSYSSQ